MTTRTDFNTSKMTHIMKHVKLLALIVLATTTVSTFGQSPWSLDDCIAYALNNNLQIRHQRLQAERAGHDVIHSYAQVLPGASASWRGGLNFGRTVDEVTNEFSTERVASQNLLLGAGVNLFAGFQTINNIRLNLARQTALRYDTESQENDIILTVANAYMQVLYFKEMLSVAEAQLENALQHKERTRILLEGGTVSRGQMLEVQAMAAEEEVRYTNAANRLEMSYLELKNLLELDPEKPFVIMQPVFKVEEMAFIFEPAEVVNKALAVEPSVSAAETRIEMAERGLSLVRGQRSPSLRLDYHMGSRYSEAAVRPVNGQHETNMLAAQPKSMALNNDIMHETVPYLDQLNENYYRTLQLTMSIPIFDNLRSRTNIQHARIDLEQARINLARTKTTLSQTIYQANADALAAYKEYISNTKALAAARESFGFAEQGFGLGMTSALEYNEAVTRLHRAEVNLLQATYEFVFLVKLLEFYQGEGFAL